MKRLFLVLSLSFSFSFSLFAHELSVGLASMDVTPAVSDEIPLGGYGSLERRNWPFKIPKHFPFIRTFKVATGSLDAIRAKAMYLKTTDKKLVFISLDVIGVTKEMRQDLARRLSQDGFCADEIIVSATHTHAGPGALSNNLFWQIIAMDRYQKKFYNRFLNQIAQTVRLAVAAAQPAELFTLSYETKGLVRNRRGNDGSLNPEANLMLARNLDGAWMGGFVNFAVHGTSLPSSNLLFSSDTPGAIERELEKLLTDMNGLVRLQTSPQMLFINGAEGDVSPNLGSHTEMGKEFARQTLAHWPQTQPLTDDWQVLQKEVYIKKPKVSLSNCVEKNWMPKGINIGLSALIPSTTIITQIHFGKLWLLTWPGEPTAEVGMQLTNEAIKTGAEKAWVFGLSNDHLAYFTTPEEFAAGGYETCANFFGARGGEILIQAHQELASLRKGLL
jgi:hypothetical protein